MFLSIPGSAHHRRDEKHHPHADNSLTPLSEHLSQGPAFQNPSRPPVPSRGPLAAMACCALHTYMDPHPPGLCPHRLLSSGNSAELFQPRTLELLHPLLLSPCQPLHQRVQTSLPPNTPGPDASHGSHPQGIPTPRPPSPTCASKSNLRLARGTLFNHQTDRVTPPLKTVSNFSPHSEQNPKPLPRPTKPCMTYGL